LDNWPCGQKPGRGPKPADALHARETMEPRRTGFDLQGQALPFGSTDSQEGMAVPSARANGRLLPALYTQSIRADPPPRRDGHCPCCGSERPDVAVKNGDPFCSTGCARGWHDQLANPSPSTGG
jgi:hypothetical protein